MKKILMFLIVCLLLAGCARYEKYAKLSASVMDCKPEQIDIENEPLIPFWDEESWEAICKGKRYICSYDPQTGVSCTEMINPFAK
ncbi:MAG: hypothetical protein A4E72_00859 [Syntrophus sp. PtaU1.Bin208]|nr:MAG: hypothetical protein A4E72_00859 [Syntrophus sp. PtaU1.Bin208]